MKGATLWKRILNEGLHLWAQQGRPRDEAAERSILTATIIVAPPSHQDEASWLDLRNVVMPFPRFWVETSIKDGSFSLVGALFDVKQTVEGFSIRATCCLCGPDFSPELTGYVGFDLDASGTPIQNRFVCDVPPAFIESAGSEMAAQAAVSCPALAACLSLMILGCKNVSLEPRDNEPKQVRRAIKRHGEGSYRYHVLVVRPPGARANSPGLEIDVMPRHVCRGHFSEYGPEFNKGLLFGKYSGRFYVPPCLKGNLKNGEVVKDYEIAPVVVT